MNAVNPLPMLQPVPGSMKRAGFNGSGSPRTRIVPASNELIARIGVSHPSRTSLFSSPAWADAVAGTYGFAIQASLLEGGHGAGEAILFCEVEDVRGRRVLSLPFCDYVDPFVNSKAAWDDAVSPILSLNAQTRFRVLHNQFAVEDSRFESRSSALWHAADLSLATEELWANLGGSAQQNIRRAERHGVVIHEGRTLDDLRSFYELHFQVRKRKYRMFTQPFALFERIHENFAKDDRIVTLLAKVDGVPVAGILFLVAGDTLYYKFNASTDLAFRPNDLLIWNGMLLGKRLRLVRLDFGLSDLAQPGLVRFKQKFATEERPIVELRWSPPGAPDLRAQETGRLLGKLTETLTQSDVPDAVTRAAGDQLYRYFC